MTTTSFFLALIGFVVGLVIYRFAGYYAKSLKVSNGSLRHSPSIELLFGLLCAFTTFLESHFIQDKRWAFIALVLVWGLLLLLLMDLKTWLLPDLLTLPLMWLGLIIHDVGLGGVSLHDALWGAILGYVLPWTLKQGYFLVTKRQGMGHGDFKLLAALGAWLGWQALPFILLLSSIMGLVVGLAIMWRQGKTITMALPFGPFLAIAGYLILLKQGH